MSRWLKYPIITLAFGAIIFVCLWWYYTKKPLDITSENEIHIALENDIQTLDPVFLTDPYTSRIIWQIYEGLIGLDASGNLIPLIAESWDASDNFKTWRFKIRDNIRFHKYDCFPEPNKTRNVTAQDVVFSYTRFAGALGSFIFTGLIEGFDSYIAKKSDQISGFKALDDHTFEIRLTRPEPAFLYRLTSPFLSIMPEEAVNLGVEKFGKNIAVGTGPFRLVHRTDTEVELEKNPEYWKASAGNIERVFFRVIKNPQFRVGEFKNGNLDIILLPTNMIPYFIDDGIQLKDKYAKKYEVSLQSTYNIHFIGVNNEILNDTNLRRAIAFAIDSNIIISTILNGSAIQADSPVFPSMLGYQSPAFIEHDMERAKEELEKSNYSGGPLKLLIHDASNSEAVGQIVQSQLDKVGINVSLEKVDFNTALNRVFTGNTPELFSMFFEWIYGAPELLFDVYRSRKIPSPNVASYVDPLVDSLIENAICESRREEINQNLFQAEEIASESAPYIWLYHAQNILLHKNTYSNVAINPHNHWLISEITVKERK